MGTKGLPIYKCPPGGWGSMLAFDGEWVSDGHVAYRKDMARLGHSKYQFLVDLGIPFEQKFLGALPEINEAVKLNIFDLAIQGFDEAVPVKVMNHVSKESTLWTVKIRRGDGSEFRVQWHYVSFIMTLKTYYGGRCIMAAKNKIFLMKDTDVIAVAMTVIDELNYPEEWEWGG